MIICKRCGNKDVYTGAPCSWCGEKFTLTSEDVKNKIEELEVAIREKYYEEMLECYHLLADVGYTDAEKEYAKILERGQLTERNLDLAMKYFYKAAKKNDPTSAYRYSRLVSRENDDAARFWLFYAAVLGCIEAYPATAEELSALGHEEDATYFYYLAAISSDVDSIVTLAKRYMEGIGAEKSEEYAKWHLDKLKIPPLHAIKLAYKLRRGVAKEPPVPKPRDYDAFLRMLALEARKEEYTTAYLKLSEILSERGDVESSATVGYALIEGDGCKQNVTEGLSLLTRSAAKGSATAHLMLYELYTNGKHFPKDVKAAIDHLRRAGELGSASAFEILGEIFYTGADVTEDVGEAIKYFALAGDLGSREAREKADRLISERDERYKAALAKDGVNDTDAFREYAISASMGNAPAMIKLADMLALGRGGIKNRGGAFLLYKRAAELGEDSALLPLGRCYADGIGTRRDFALARKTLSKAERLGVEGAHELITEVMQRKMKKLSRRLYSTAMRLVYKKNYGEAKRLLEIAGDLCEPSAIYTLGCIYEFGMGVKCNKNLAYDYYEKAFSMKFRDPRSKYKLSVLRLLKS
jgi:TPR repeat protein